MRYFKFLTKINWTGVFAVLVVCAVVALIVQGEISLYKEGVARRASEDARRTFKANQTKQCDKVCHPYKLVTSENEYCLCANSSTVIWRKDIK